MANKNDNSVTVRRIEDQPRIKMKAKRTLYVDADGNPTDDSANASQQITEKGVEILPHVLAQYDFEDGDLKVAKKAAAKPEPEPEADKAAVDKDDAKSTAPTENKSASPAKATKSK